MSKLPPLPPLPRIDSVAKKGVSHGAGGNSRNDQEELLTDEDLLELAEPSEPRTMPAGGGPARGEAPKPAPGGRVTPGRSTLLGSPAQGTPPAVPRGSGLPPPPGAKGGAASKPPGTPPTSRPAPQGEITPRRDPVDMAALARAADALGKGLVADQEGRAPDPPAEVAEKHDATASGKDLAPIDDGKKSKKDEDQVQKLPLEGRRFGRFELLLQMGQGGMATLFLARIRGPQNFEKHIAIKKIHDHLSQEDEFVEMFLDEARISAMIHHPNVVQIFDLGSIEGAYFIAMEYVHGQDFSQVLRSVIRTRNETYGWPYAARMVADAAAGLHAAHELTDADGKPLGLVHRDVSPQNILVSYDGHVKVVDFGIAYAAEKISQTGVGILKGKAAYMSPEQSRGQHVDRRSDVFALGILLFESVCLKRLFREENEAATLLRVGAADVPRPRSIRPDLPAELERIILKALAKDPDNRFASAQELQSAIEQLLVSKGSVVGPAQTAQLMNELFHDRKRIRDQQLRDVAARVTSQVRQAIGVSTTTVTQMGNLDEAETGPPRRWLMPVIIVLVALVALTLTAVLGLPLLRGDKDGAPAPAKATVAKPTEPRTEPRVAEPLRPPPERVEPQVEKILLEITVEPKSASPTILFRGKEYRQHNLELLVEPSDAPEVVRVDAPGFRQESRHVTVNAKMELKHEFRLKRIPVPGRPPPRPMPPGDDLKYLPD